jgi:hypothetical protein
MATSSELSVSRPPRNYSFSQEFEERWSAEQQSQKPIRRVQSSISLIDGSFEISTEAEAPLSLAIIHL